MCSGAEHKQRVPHKPISIVLIAETRLLTRHSLRKEGFILAQFRICVCLSKWDVHKIQAPVDFRKRAPAPQSLLELQLQMCEPPGMGAGTELRCSA